MSRRDVPGGGGSPCPDKLSVAAFLTLKAMWTHRRELPALWRESEAYR